MSIRLVNGKLELDRKPKHLDAPSPSQIAERAYDLAETAAFDCVRTAFGIHAAAEVRASLLSQKAELLAELRRSVVEPAAIPWWRKP